LAEVLLQVKARQPAKDRRARNHVQATADVQVLKAVRCHFKEEFLREDLTRE